MTKNGFQDFKQIDNYLYSSATNTPVSATPHLGAYRMKVEYAPCGDVSLCAQLIKNSTNSEWTFRKWNPLKLNLPWGSETSADIDEDCGGSWICYICKIVNCCMDSLFEEVVYLINEETKSADDMLSSEDEKVKKLGNFMRPCAIFTCMLGFFFLFSPIVGLLTWIPLIGALLGMIVQVVAAIVAFIVGGALSCFVLALAWIRFRPCIGISLMLVVGLGIAAVFVVPTMI